MAFQQDPYPGADPTEIATLTVAGQVFSDWESVWVQTRWTSPFPYFRFSCCERDPLPIAPWEKQQFRPGNECTIKLGDAIAVTGLVLVRQVAYDANSHGIQIEGVGLQWYAERSSIVDDKANYDGLSLQQIADKVLAPTGVKAIPKGNVPDQKFEKAQPHPGDTIYAFLDRLARMRDVIIGSDHLGNVLLIGKYSAGAAGALVEGENILSCQCVISNKLYSMYIARGQTEGNDEQNGTFASRLEAQIRGSAVRYSPIVIPVEQPVKGKDEVQMRAQYEYNLWEGGESIEANITVQGWFDQSGALWRAGSVVRVHSPMALLYNMNMGVDMVTYTQDSRGGTRTTLQCFPPWRIGASSNILAPGSTNASPEQRIEGSPQH